MAWHERNLFQKFDLLFPYRNLVTSILFFFLFPRVTILTRTFPRTETFSINYIPLAAASLRYLISYLSPRIQRTVFQPPRLANSHGRKKKKKKKRERKKKNVYATHRTPFPSSIFEEKRYRTPSRIPPSPLRQTNFHRPVTRRVTVRNAVFFSFIYFFIFSPRQSSNPKPADWCVELYLSRGPAAV